ncbi:MAG: hypothetical protein KatS3mg031_2619 [Chitinophagales bacterium]|nr:MAG: hypothetical protein KatS3mg031_2619 [Chitinophagales bacterium]
MDKHGFLTQIQQQGYYISPRLFSDSFINRLKAELERAIAAEAAFHKTTRYREYGMLLACPLYGGAFLELLHYDSLIEPFNWALGETCIIYVYTSSSMPPKGTNYSSRLHVDRPMFIPGYLESLACLIPLDDFTEENGATYFLPGSHLTANPPDEEYFYKNATRLVTERGTVFYFNPRLWHAGGYNHTHQWRHAVGMAMVRPYLKQRIDLPRAMKGMDLSHVPDKVLQKLGFFAQPPASLEEYYAPPDQRPYRQPSEWETNLP